MGETEKREKRKGEEVKENWSRIKVTPQKAETRAGMFTEWSEWFE